MQPQLAIEQARNRNPRRRKSTMDSKFASLAIIAAAVLGLTLASTRAATLEWADTGADGDFFTAANWTDADTGDPAAAPPANNDTIVMGAGAYAATMGAAYTPGNMAIGAGAELVAQASLNWTTDGGVYSNAGTVRFADNNSLWSLLYGEVGNSGIIEADGINLQWRSSPGFTIDNTNGIIRAANGGVLESVRWGGVGQGIDITGGMLAIGSGSGFSLDTQYGGIFNLTETTVLNEGTMRVTGPRTGTGGSVPHVGLVVLDGGFTNQGELIIEKTGDFPRNMPYVAMNGTSTFVNQGTVVIYQETGFADHSARLTSVNSVYNEGVIEIVNPDALLRVDSGNAFIQSAGAVNLENGGELRASQVDILGGSLTGDGVITGDTTVAAGAAVAPGTSIGTLTFAGDLTLAGTYQLEIDKLLGTADLLDVQGVLTLDGAVLDISYFAYQPGEQSFLIATASGGITGTFATVIAPANYSLFNDGNQLWLAIPEPSSLMLLVLAGFGLLRRRRSGIFHVAGKQAAIQLRRSRQPLAILGIALVGVASQAAVITSTWTGGAGTFNWADAGNWDSVNAPDNNADTYEVVFATAPGGEIDLGTNRVIDTLDIQATTLLGDSGNIGNHTLTISGGLLNDTSGGTNVYSNLAFGNDLTFNKPSGGRLLLHGSLESSNTFTKTGSGELRTTGNSDSTSTFTGDVDIQDGLLFISNNGGVGNSSSQTVTIHSGARLNQGFAGGTLNYGAIIMNGGALSLRGCTVASDISGFGTISSSAGGGVALSGDNSGFTGTLTFTGGNLSINGELGTSDIAYSASGSTLGGTGTIHFNIVDDDYDTIRIFNDATFSIGNMGLALDVSGDLALETVIADYTGGNLTGGQFASVTGLPWYAELIYGGTDLHPNSIVMIIPEPSSLALLALASLGLLRRRR